MWVTPCPTLYHFAGLKDTGALSSNQEYACETSYWSNCAYLGDLQGMAARLLQVRTEIFLSILELLLSCLKFLC